MRAERALRPKSQELVGARDVLGRGELAIGFRAFDQRDVETVPLSDAGIVGEGGAVFRRGAVRGKDRIEAEALRRLRAPQVIAGSVPVARPALPRSKVSVTGRQGRAPAWLSRLSDDAADQSGIDERTRGVMDQHAIGRVDGKRLEARADRSPVAARRPAIGGRNREEKGCEAAS